MFFPLMQEAWMKLYIMLLPWRGSRRSRLCLLWAERHWGDVSTSWCPSAWLASSIILALRQVHPIMFYMRFGQRDDLNNEHAIQCITLSVVAVSSKPVESLSLRPQGLFNRLVSLTEEARKAYKDMVSALEQEQAEEALKNDKKTPHQLGHYRNHSAASAISFCSILSEPISEVNEKEYGEQPLPPSSTAPPASGLAPPTSCIQQHVCQSKLHMLNQRIQ